MFLNRWTIPALYISLLGIILIYHGTAVDWCEWQTEAQQDGPECTASGADCEDKWLHKEPTSACSWYKYKIAMIGQFNRRTEGSEAPFSDLFWLAVVERQLFFPVVSQGNDIRTVLLLCKPFLPTSALPVPSSTGYLDSTNPVAALNNCNMLCPPQSYIARRSVRLENRYQTWSPSMPSLKGDIAVDGNKFMIGIFVCLALYILFHSPIPGLF
jgi:hypothetical protein